MRLGPGVCGWAYAWDALRHDVGSSAGQFAFGGQHRPRRGQGRCAAHLGRCLIDVTARRLKEDEARTAAERDPLTGLYNRRGYELFLDRALRRAGEDGVSLGILMMDLDGFKQVNDVLQGHAAGVKTVAQRLQSRVRRSSDLVGRLGGDEFVVIRHDCGQDPALLESLAADLVQLVGQPIGLANGVEVRVGISIGLAVYPRHGSLRQALLHQADEAMYAVKRGGKNGYAWPATQA